MPYKIGLVGLPNVGKSSLFRLLTKKNILVANYPFATIDPNVGIMSLDDPRLTRLGEFWQSRKITPSQIQIIDIAGLVRGASQGSGLGNEFLSHLREVDLICQVLRCFPEKEIIHVENSVDPIRDFSTIQLELILADWQQVNRKLTKLKIRDEKSQKEQEICQLIAANLEKEIPVSRLDFSPEEKALIKSYNLLTDKPFFLLANYSGDRSEITELEEYVRTEKLTLFPLPVKLQEAASKLSAQEQEEIGCLPADFSVFSAQVKSLLKLKTFFTVGEDETKSWLASENITARQGAGLIHSDLEKNFIKAEIYNYTE
ncbi:34488_t:CDS:1 [Racocetra persica]|uniref:34488_t:CDS:1 n=1 Tax=Racocetra persica TaxID=160502 RepID=A0ACA9MZH2_9GLOM|nr:34488_t:CDS:1 [Racocetra persica]